MGVVETYRSYLITSALRLSQSLFDLERVWTKEVPLEGDETFLVRLWKEPRSS